MEELEPNQIFEIIYNPEWISITITVLSDILTGIASVFFLGKMYSTSTTLNISVQYDSSIARTAWAL